MDIDLGKEGEKKFEGQFVYTLLEKARLKFDTYLAMYDVIDACVGYLTGGGGCLQLYIHMYILCVDMLIC